MSMQDDTIQRIERLFQEGLDIDAAQREAWLDRAAGGDAEVSGRVRALLEQHDRDESLSAFVLDLDTAEMAEGAGAVIGRYKLLQRIGEGGFGVVYMAEQREPVTRKVALKVIKLGMDTKQVVARFEAERQALALMDHPDIAKVLDAGTTDSGRPYFVMELVRGVAITEFCDANNLSARDRLALFERVCLAIQHAHTKGVIHRDIKPSNVLVTLSEGKPIPKIIDFGIAKAMHGRLTDKTLFTEFRHFIGTPAYMSPEQAEMTALEVDTRTDVYSLGVLLYELLTGTTPFDAADLLRSGVDEMKRVIREQDPPRPSVRISSSADAHIAAHRGSDTPALSRLVRGDLDWIVMRALEKERGRRYATAQELAADVRRHLEGHAVDAGPPGAGYRVRKFVTRNRVAVTSVTLIALTLLVGIVGTTWAMVEAGRSRDAAVVNAAAAREQEATARRQARRANAVLGFIQETLAVTDPEVTLDPELSVRDLLRQAGVRAGEDFTDDPAVEAVLQSTIGQAYASLGALEQAEIHLRRAATLMRTLGDVDVLDRYHTLWSLTEVAFRIDRDDAFHIFRECNAVGLDAIRTDQPELATVLGDYVIKAEESSHSTEARTFDRCLDLFERARRLASRVLPATEPRWSVVANTYMAGAYTLWYSPYESRTDVLWREALDIQRRLLPARHPRVGQILSQLVGVLSRSGRAAEAEELIEDSLELLRESLRPDHWRIAFAESMLGECYVKQERFEEAEPLLKRSYVAITRRWEPGQFFALDAAKRLVGLYDAWGRPGDAAPYRAVLAREFARAKWVLPWPLAGSVFGDLGETAAILEELNRTCGFQYAAAPGASRGDVVKPLLDRLLIRPRAGLGADDPRAAVLGRLLLVWGNALDPVNARAVRGRMAAEALELLRPRWEASVQPEEIAEALTRVASVDQAAGRTDAARAAAREAWAVLGAREARTIWTTAVAHLRIARVLSAVGLHAEAEKILLPAFDVLVGQLGASHADAVAARDALRSLYEAWGRPDQAARYR